MIEWSRRDWHYYRPQEDFRYPHFDPSKLSPWWHKKVGKFEIALGLLILSIVWIPFLKNIFS